MGSRDKQPQFRNLNVSESAINTFTQQEFTILSVDRKEVMEILKLFVDIEEPDLEDVALNDVRWQLTKSSQTSMLAFNDDDVIMAGRQTVESFDTGTTDATIVIKWERPIVFDLTDGNGNGYISPKSNIFLAIQGAGNAVVKFVSMKILFTWLKISVDELIDFLRED